METPILEAVKAIQDAHKAMGAECHEIKFRDPATGAKLLSELRGHTPPDTVIPMGNNYVKVRGITISWPWKTLEVSRDDIGSAAAYLHELAVSNRGEDEVLLMKGAKTAECLRSVVSAIDTMAGTHNG